MSMLNGASNAVEWGGQDGLVITKVLAPAKGLRSDQDAAFRVGMRLVKVVVLADEQVQEDEELDGDGLNEIANAGNGSVQFHVMEERSSPPDAPNDDGVLGEGSKLRAQYSSLGVLAAHIRSVITDQERLASAANGPPDLSAVRAALRAPTAWEPLWAIDTEVHTDPVSREVISGLAMSFVQIARDMHQLCKITIVF
jgi:hypothetical protein